MTDRCDKYNCAVICIGSNVANRHAVVDAALVDVSCGGVVRVSSGLYETDADNGVDAPYINLVAVVDIALDLDTLKALTKKLEREAGRTVASTSSAMPLDIDIIMWNGDVVDRRQYEKSYFKEGYAKVAVSQV